MRKLSKFVIMTILTTSFSLQAVACKNNTKYDSFLSDVSNTKNTDSAFFGFLGSKNDEISKKLQTSFDFLNQKENNNKSPWEKWNYDYQATLNNHNIKTVQLLYYQEPSQENSNSEPASAFWNNKNLSWQKNIFKWIYNHTDRTKNPNFKISHGVDDVKQINTKKDSSNNDMFTKLPIVFIISKGQLITAGENWINSSSINTQKEAINEFIQANLFLTAY